MNRLVFWRFNCVVLTAILFHHQQSDRPDVPGVATWNVDVFLQVVKEMVRSSNNSNFYTLCTIFELFR